MLIKSNPLLKNGKYRTRVRTLAMKITALQRSIHERLNMSLLKNGQFTLQQALWLKQARYTLEDNLRY